MAHPRFLKALASPAPRRCLDKAARAYHPLLGIWLIDLALLFGWYHPSALVRLGGRLEDAQMWLEDGLMFESQVGG